jgi:esterase
MHAYSVIALLHAASAMTSTLPPTTTTTTPITTPHILTSAEIVRRAPSQGSDRRPVVVLHGLLGQKRNFRSWCAALAEAVHHKRRIVTLDLRGHGDSPHGPLEYPSMASDVLATLESLQIKECCLVGHSMGGKVAMACALRAPALVKELCVLDMAPASYSTADGSNWKKNRELIDALANLDLDACSGDKKRADSLLARKVLDPSLRAFALTNLQLRDEQLSWQFDLDGIVRDLDNIARWPTLPGTYNGDTLFVKGQRSRYVRSIHLAEISAKFPRFTLQSIDDCGHWVHAEKPQETCDVVREFLDRDDVA